MKFSDLKAIELDTFYKWQGGLPVILPFVGYVAFGLANIYFFSTAIKHIPMAMAFAVWTATTLVFLKIAEVAFFHERTSWPEVFFMLLIMIGILGLKIYAIPAK
jgi:quaternary ammonium compound-resistance protein SugE